MKDTLDKMLTEVAQEDYRASGEPEALGPHPSEDLLIAHLNGDVGGDERRELIHHLACCGACVDRLVHARGVLSVELFPVGTPRFPGALQPLDVGPVLLGLGAEVGVDAVQVLWSDAEMRVGLATSLRRSRAKGHDGVSFVRHFVDGSLSLELMGSHHGRVQLSLTMPGVPGDARVSVIVGGRLCQSEPFTGDQVLLRDIPLRTCLLRIDTPRGVLGHCRLELRSLSGDATS